jgi:DNA-binding HxlR family transcriptional regulator
MAGAESEPEFNASRAELFEALGHPIRIKILQALERKPMGFAELKRATGIESSGHLSFHLAKLGGLLKVGVDGEYALTDEGREALRVVSVTRESQSGGIKVAMVRPSLKLAAVVAIAALVLLGAVVVVQQQQIGNLSRQVSQGEMGTVLINGTRYAYVDIPLASLTYPAVFRFDGVTFNITAGSTGTYVVFTSPWTTFSTGSHITIAVTVTAGSGTAIPITVRLVPWPSVKITFSDGTSEYYQTGTEALSAQSAASPWFSQHSNPRAGVMWDLTSNSCDLYVSVGS